MKNLFLTLSILFSIHTLDSLVAQTQLLKPIEIKKNKFYQEGIRLKPGKPLEFALMKANNKEINDLFRKGKNTQTLGTIIESLGLLVMGVGLLSGGDSVGSYALGGSAILLTGVVVSLPGFSKKKKAVVKYNEVIAKM
ncbi:MAG: hypothetical protein IPO78_01095 [Saprospiraceae bacterium]|nr:hypothetical protein [Saprospiraceae bacterium]MBK8450388.1 hypothetical protein [Saprospiraceae bacterium]MBK8485532.1 hypothetical protein [Saprospiraceae bacterium]MBK9222759.1 hypothetical protein [Saprospiraceae bacterium]MBK9720198.1 hypothetical protein [Saprospiraceae bacterium]